MEDSENFSPSHLETTPKTDVLRLALDSGLSVITAYTPTGIQAVQETSDRRSVKRDYWGIDTAFDTGTDLVRFLQTINDANIYEIASLRALDKPVMDKRTVVIQKGFLGVGRKTREESYITSRVPLKTGEVIAGTTYKDEPAVALDYFATDGYVKNSKDRLFRDRSGRPGNLLAAEIILPQSIAALVSEEMKKDPRFIRNLIDALIEQKYPQDFIQQSWVRYARPPYEAWDRRPERKIYFADLIKNAEKAHLPPTRVLEGAISY